MEDAMVFRLRLLVSGTFLMTLCAIAGAQNNPLYEHRRSVATDVSAKVLLEESYVVHADVARVTLGTPSSHLLDAGVKSGDPMFVDLGAMSLRVNAAFRDELERRAGFAAESQKSAPPYAGPTLVIDREDPTQPIVLETSLGDAFMHVSVEPGSKVQFGRAGRATAPARRQE
jgi:hypothetical protein